MTCDDTKDNAGIYIFIPVSKTITIIVVSFHFLYIVFYWNYNVKLFFSLADTAVKKKKQQQQQQKKQEKYMINIKKRLPCLFSNFLKYETIVSPLARPYFTP